MPRVKMTPLVTTASMFALLAMLAPDPAPAGGFAIGVPGLGTIGIGGFGGFGRGSHGRHGHNRDKDKDESSAEKPADKPGKPSASAAMLARTSTEAVFKSIVVSKGLGAVGIPEEIETVKYDQVRDEKRDYTGAITYLLTKIDDEAKQNRREGDPSVSQGDVTQHAIDRAVSHSYETAHLSTFEQFVGEQWTSERLRVAILDRTATEVPGLLKGNNSSVVQMAPIDDIIQRAGQAIYKQTFEMSELIAVNQATARFTRALFETHGPMDGSDLRESVEDMLLSASRPTLAEYDERFVRSEFGIVLRYRAERIILDCLTGNVDEIASVGGKPATRQQMSTKVDELSRGECHNWVVNALGPANQTGGKDDEQILKPLPIRAVWIAPGVPKTDASMFGRVTNNL